MNVLAFRAILQTNHRCRILLLVQWKSLAASTSWSISTVHWSASFPAEFKLFSSAIAFVFGEITDITSSDWDRALGVNVKGYALCIKHAALAMRKQGRGGTLLSCSLNEAEIFAFVVGSIINIGSISSWVAQPAFVPYNTTKGAILQLTRCAAMDLGKDRIRVNCVCPGCIGTICVLCLFC